MSPSTSAEIPDPRPHAASSSSYWGGISWGHSHMGWGVGLKWGLTGWLEIGIEASYSQSLGCLAGAGWSRGSLHASEQALEIRMGCVYPAPGCDPAMGAALSASTFCLRAFASGKSLAWRLPEPSVGVWGQEVGQEWGQGFMAQALRARQTGG